MKLRFRKFGIYGQTLALFLLLLIPVQTVGTSLLFHSAGIVRQNVIDKSRDQLENALNHLINQIAAIQQQANAFLYNSSSYLRRPFSEMHQERPGAHWITIRNVMNELTWIKFSNDMVQEIYALYPTLGFSVTTSQYRIITQDASSVYGTYSVRPVYSDKKLILSLIYPTNLSNVNKAIIILNIHLSAEALRLYTESKVYSGECIIRYDRQWIAGSDSMMAYFAKNPVVEKEPVVIDGTGYYMVTASDSDSGFALVNLIPSASVDATNRSMRLLIYLYGLLSILTLSVYALIMRRLVYRPIQRLLNGYQSIGAGNLDTRVEISGPTELAQLQQGLNEMTENLNTALQDLYEQKVYTQQIELKQLQAQINPHFLYNTFFALERMVQDENAEAAEATCRYLGEYFQYITYSGKQTAMLRDEYAHAVNYLMLQKVRYEERLMLEVPSLPPDLENIEVPKLIFQPILENIFAHALQQTNGTMTVRISIRKERGLLILFENSAMTPPKDALAIDLNAEAPEGKVTGLFNIHRRIQLKYGSPYGLSLAQSDLGGLLVTVRLPLSGEEAHASV